MIDINNINGVGGDNMNSMTESQMKSVEDWLSNGGEDTPDFIKSLSAGIKHKIEYSMCYILAQHMRRSINLLNYLEDVEKVLYDKTSIHTKETEELQKLYAEASKTASSSLEWVRKYTVQNKDMLTPKDEKTDLLLDLVSTLSQEEMNKLIETIQNMKH